MKLPTALTIAGSDSGGGAGIQADLKTFHELGVHGTSAITALTAQNTLGVHAVHEVPAELVRAQVRAVVDDIGADAVKTGMLASPEIVSAVVGLVRELEVEHLVVDPVCASKHGDRLLSEPALEVLKNELLPLAEIVTPNVGEVELLTGLRVNNVRDLPVAAAEVHRLGPRWVLIKGGHLSDNPEAVDLLFDGEQAIPVTGEHVESRDTHGTGCTLAAAIAAGLAHGRGVATSVRLAKDYLDGALRDGVRIGQGIGPVDHGWRHRR